MFGEFEKDSIKIPKLSKKQGEVLDARPTLTLWQEILWDAFVVLNDSRQLGFGPSPISVADVKAYFEIVRIPMDEEMLIVIKALDAEWLRDYASKHGNG